MFKVGDRVRFNSTNVVQLMRDLSLRDTLLVVGVVDDWITARSLLGGSITVQARYLELCSDLPTDEEFEDLWDKVAE